MSNPAYTNDKEGDLVPNVQGKVPEYLHALLMVKLKELKLTQSEWIRKSVEDLVGIKPAPVPFKMAKPWWEHARAAHELLRGCSDPEAMSYAPRFAMAVAGLQAMFSSVPAELQPKVRTWLAAVHKHSPIGREAALDTFEYGMAKAAEEDYVASMPRLAHPNLGPTLNKPEEQPTVTIDELED